VIEAIAAAAEPPRLYLVNANSLVKRQAVAHLAGDIVHYRADVCVVTETHLNEHLADRNYVIGGYDLLRRDRLGRRGGGVAVYASRQVA